MYSFNYKLIAVHSALSRSCRWRFYRAQGAVSQRVPAGYSTVTVHAHCRYSASAALK